MRRADKTVGEGTDLGTRVHVISATVYFSHLKSAVTGGVAQGREITEELRAADCHDASRGDGVSQFVGNSRRPILFGYD